VLWQQPASQDGFSPILVVGDAVYGSTQSDSVVSYTGNGVQLPIPTLALSLATGQVAQNKFAGAVPILVTDDGYALVYPADGTGDYLIFKSDLG
jgi:hypothetical protein